MSDDNKSTQKQATDPVVLEMEAKYPESLKDL